MARPPITATKGVYLTVDAPNTNGPHQVLHTGIIALNAVKMSNGVVRFTLVFDATQGAEIVDEQTNASIISRCHEGQTFLGFDNANPPVVAGTSNLSVVLDDTTNDNNVKATVEFWFTQGKVNGSAVLWPHPEA